ncbi:hypothetical protein [Methyloversatilis thermotolerans]|uniref:hypothetical protein n=1 Tax=Methyloversatilis thermotolerans TaxID=1346290 RepID=UPI0003A1B07E|nr:hypothetical protein [Methyloversatilis thermotolerans]
MPMITLNLSRRPDADTMLAVRRAVLDLTVDVLRKKKAQTALSAQSVDDWSVGGVPVEARQMALHLEVRVTVGTTTAHDRTRFMAAAWSSLEELLGPLHPSSYCIVTEVPADAWSCFSEAKELARACERLAP